MTEAEHIFSITAIEWTYIPSNETGHGRREVKPLRGGPRVLGLHCNQCGATFTARKHPLGEAPGSFAQFIGFVHVWCSHCDAHEKIPNKVIEETSACG